MSEYNEVAFPSGVVIFFRQMAADGSLARSVLPAGRNVSLGGHSLESHNEDYIVIDSGGKFLGCFPREYVAAILPLETTGPGNENNPPTPTRN